MSNSCVQDRLVYVGIKNCFAVEPGRLRACLRYNEQCVKCSIGYGNHLFISSTNKVEIIKITLTVNRLVKQKLNKHQPYMEV